MLVNGIAVVADGGVDYGSANAAVAVSPSTCAEALVTYPKGKTAEGCASASNWWNR
jgi:hypothetical protein